VLNEIMFESEDDDDKEGTSCELSALAALEEGRATDVDLAIFLERHNDISDINESMKHINQIQRGEFAVTG
jgi:hypothetical protein